MTVIISLPPAPTIGTLPPPAEGEAFVADERPDKRGKKRDNRPPSAAQLFDHALAHAAIATRKLEAIISGADIRTAENDIEIRISATTSRRPAEASRAPTGKSPDPAPMV